MWFVGLWVCALCFGGSIMFVQRAPSGRIPARPQSIELVRRILRGDGWDTLVLEPSPKAVVRIRVEE